jgi:hypothetical protein
MAGAAEQSLTVQSCIKHDTQDRHAQCTSITFSEEDKALREGRTNVGCEAQASEQCAGIFERLKSGGVYRSTFGRSHCSAAPLLLLSNQPSAVSEQVAQQLISN